MHIRPPENPTEDRLIGNLDRGIPLDREADEMALILAKMQVRQKMRLAELMANLKAAR